MSDTLTTAQANDLARYFLGREWSAFYSPHNKLPCLVVRELTPEDDADYFEGNSWEEVFRAAGVNLPSRQPWPSHGSYVQNDAKATTNGSSD